MNAINTESEAIRRLTAGRGDPVQRVTAAETLAAVGEVDQTVLRALIQGLWDDDQAVREVCESTLEELFHDTDTGGRQLFIETLFTRLAGDPDPPTEVVSLLFRIVGWVRNHDTEESHLFTTVLAEADRKRSRVRRAFTGYNQQSTDESQSAELVAQFERQWALDQLRSETAPPREIEDALQALGDRPLGETKLEVLLYHLIPLRASHNYQVMNTALENLQTWTDELPADDKFDLTDSVEVVKEYRRERRDQLPGELRNEIGLSEFAIDALVDDLERLASRPEYERLLDSVLDVLRGVDGVREHVEAITSIAQESDGETREHAVTLLCDLLAGLDEASGQNEALLQRTYDDTTAAADETIRETFETLATEEGVAADQARTAAQTLIQSRPPDLDERLRMLIDDRPADDPVVEAVLETIADEAVLDATEPIVELFERLSEGDARGATAAIETLEALGHDPARRAFQQEMEDGSGEVADESRQALIRSGSYEQVRAFDLEERATSLAAQSESAEVQRTRLEDQRRDRRSEYKRLEIQLREQVFEGDQILRCGLLDVTEGRIDGIDTLAELQLEDQRVERLLQQASSFHQRLSQYVNRLPLGEDVRDGMVEELRAIDHDLEYAERLVNGDGDRVTELESQIGQLEADKPEEDAGCSDADAALARELWELERDSLTELRERYRAASQEREERVSRLRSRFDRERQHFRNATPDSYRIINDIQSAIDVAQSRANQIESLTARREQEWEQVQNALDRRDQDLADLLERIEETISELERVQRRINELSREIAELRVEQQHLSQRAREDEEAYERIEPRARGEAEALTERALEREEFFTHRQIYQNFIRRYYELQLDIVSQQRFREEHEETLDTIEQELATHLE